MTVGLQGSLFGATEEVRLRRLSPRRTWLSDGAWIDVQPGWLAGADTLFERLRPGVPWRAERRRMYDRVVDVPRLLSFYDEDDPLPDPVLAQARAALTRHYADELREPFRTAGLCLYRDGRDSVAWHGDTIGRGSREDTMVAILSVGAPRSLLLRPRGGGTGGGGTGGRQAGSGQTGSGQTSSGEAGSEQTGSGQTSSGQAGAEAAGSGPASSGQAGGGRTIRRALGPGDLIVMGGSCQRTWEHAIPKTGKPVGPRISIQFRPRGVR